MRDIEKARKTFQQIESKDRRYATIKKLLHQEFHNVIAAIHHFTAKKIPKK